jgi:hypothetical protein
MRVANETKAWRIGDVLFFDDSWEHEVWNRCPAERVVLQLVFAHPDLVERLQRGAQDTPADDTIIKQVFGLGAPSH